MSVALELLEKRNVVLYILSLREIWSVVLARPGRAIARQLDTVHAEIFENERVLLVTTRQIGTLTRSTMTKSGRAPVKTLYKLINVWFARIDRCFT